MLEGMNEFSSVPHVGMDMKEVGRSIPFLEPKELRLLPHNGALCDRTTSEMRGLSPKIISGDS
jgi:hypothetical protein